MKLIAKVRKAITNRADRKFQNSQEVLQDDVTRQQSMNAYWMSANSLTSAQSAVRELEDFMTISNFTVERTLNSN